MGEQQEYIKIADYNTALVKQRWQQYSADKNHFLPQELFVLTLEHSNDHIEIMNTILANEHRPTLLYCLERIISVISLFELQILLLNPFNLLAAKDPKMKLLNYAIDSLYKFRSKHSSLINECNFALMSKFKGSSEEFNSLCNKYLQEMSDITNQEITKSIAVLKSMEVESPAFAKKLA